MNISTKDEKYLENNAQQEHNSTDRIKTELKQLWDNNYKSPIFEEKFKQSKLHCRTRQLHQRY